MLYSIEELEKDVRVALNANSHEQPLLDDPWQLRLSEVVRACACRAAEAAVMEAPAWMLERGHTFGDSLHWHEDEAWGYVPLPRNFLRLVSFEMSDWRMAVTDPITQADEAYWQQRLPYPGLRGNPQLPVCAVVNRPEGLALEFYSCAGQSACVKHAFYVPRPCIDADGYIDISEPLYDATVEKCASLVKKIITNQTNTVER